MTSARAAALNQNSRGIAAAMATARVASLRPRMMYSARPRIPVQYPLITGSDCCSATVAVGVGQQGQVARTLDSDGQLALVLGLCTGDTAGYDLAGFGDVGLQGVEILVIDLFNAFSGKTAELSATEKTCHGSVSFLTGMGTEKLTRRQRLCCRQPRWRCRSRRNARGPHGARHDRNLPA